MASLNGSRSNLLGLEKLLSSVLGPKANKKGSFKLLKADVSAQTYLKIAFKVEKQLREGDGVNLEGFPEWRTKPEKVKLHFEALAKVEGDKVVPGKGYGGLACRIAGFSCKDLDLLTFNSAETKSCPRSS